MIFLFVICTLAIFRLTSLLVVEEGPYKIFDKLRIKARKYTDGLDCFLCVSVYVALPFSFLFPYWYIVWFALSAGAILIEAVIDRLREQ